jgi:tetratricopeptide (TPR) repeat protein
MRAALILLLAYLLPAAVAAQTEARQLLQDGNRAYHNQDFAQAIDSYERLLQQGVASAALYHNLGNAYYRSGDLPRAVLQYKRGLRLAPKDEQLQQNLRLARQQLPGNIVNIQQSGVVSFWLSLQESLSARAWSIIGILGLWLAGTGLGFWQFGRRRFHRKLGFVLGLILLLLSVLPFAWAYGRAQQQYFRMEAVVLSETTALQAAPEAESKELQPVYEGDVVRVLDSLSTWYKVRLEDTSEGWLPKDQLVVI